ncbi:MAG TPA: hypothetical protein VFP84_36795 [Kofleriaceae bacterium]|nr:hypothetical protein [Kofleriaceae bacterium]
MNALNLVDALLLILGGILATAGIIVAKRPDARQVIDRLMPFQVLIGVGLLVLGLVTLLASLGRGLIGAISHTPIFGMTYLALSVISILLGFLFGMPQILKALQGNAQAEQRAMQAMAQIAPYQVIIGAIGIIAALLTLAYELHILSPLTL